MIDTAPTHTLDAPPSADDVRSYRQDAADSGDSVVVAYVYDGSDRHLVVSPRGTCVVLEGGTSNDAMNPDTAPEAVAEACRA